MRFADPWYLLALIPTIWWMVRLLRGLGAVDTAKTSNSGLYDAHGSGSLDAWFVKLPNILRFAAMILIIVALARPQTGYSEREITSKGIDIMLTLDLSSSMSVNDLEPNRLAAAKKVLKQFIDGRVNDRIGLVVFAAQGYTQCPLTLDYPVLAKFLEEAHIGLIDDGTAIGMALATAANRLKDSPAVSKIVVLLTDGENNAGAIDPLTAANMAKTVGLKVYTIGVGREGIFTQTVNDPRTGPRKVRTRTYIDEKLLTQIAESTGGKFFRAQDEKALANIYQIIDRMEKTDIKVKIYAKYTDWFHWLLGPALLLLLCKLLLPLTRFRVLP